MWEPIRIVLRFVYIKHVLLIFYFHLHFHFLSISALIKYYFFLEELTYIEGLISQSL